MKWTTALPDWEERTLAGKSLIPCAPLFPDEAAAAMAIFRELRIVDAAGSPTIGEACRPWVLDFAQAIFGAYDAEAGRRLIRDFFLLVSKKNSKSTLAAAIMLTALIRNWRLSGEFYILSPTIEVAGNSFLPARDMVRADEELSDLLHVQDHLRTITHRGTGAFLKVVAADSETVSGKKTIGLLVDEFWLFGKRAGSENMLREARGGLASRPEGFEIDLTTQSDEPPAGVFKQRLKRYRDIRDGRIVDPKSLGVLYEFPERMLKDNSYRDPDNFYITNPNLGASVDREFLVDEYLKAVDAGEGSLRGFASKHLNVEIGINLGSDRWPGADHWEASADKKIKTVSDLLARCEVVVIGIDGGGLDDLLGLTVIGREIGTRHWLSWSKAWAHQSVFERRKSEASRLSDFAKAGELGAVERLGDDIDELVAIVAEVNDAGLLADIGGRKGIGLDPVGIGQIIDALVDAEIIENDEQVIGITQGWKLAGAIKSTERKLADGTMCHADQALMGWCVGNAKLEQRGNAVLITKQTAGSGKIDPLMALFDAVALMSMNPDSSRSVYEERGLLVL